MQLATENVHRSGNGQILVTKEGRVSQKKSLSGNPSYDSRGSCHMSRTNSRLFSYCG